MINFKQYTSGLKMNAEKGYIMVITEIGALLFLAFGGLLSASGAGVLTSSVWAVLVVGSNGWVNYRHQADICHAYQVLIKSGVPKERIIVLMYDDIANNSLNPKKGVIINEPNGSNVYEGVVIDYRGDDVTVDTFKNVLLGNRDALKHKGTGRVLESGKNDHVFINFVDHGGTGMLVFPSESLYAKDLLEIFRQMKINDKFGELVMFVEACEAGSMFDNLLGHFDNIIVSTASAPDESSWGWYCDTGTCLGDLYSVTWMNRMEKLNFTESIFEQYDAVRSAILPKSHVNLYGDYRLGFIQFGSKPTHFSNNRANIKEQNLDGKGINNRDVPIYLARKELETVQLLVYNQLNSSDMNDVINEKKQKLQQLVMGRRIADNIISSILNACIKGDTQLPKYLENKRLPLNENMFDCYKNIVSAFNTHCFDVTKHYYFLKHLYKFSNICVKELNETVVIEAIQVTCQGLNFNGIII